MSNVIGPIPLDDWRFMQMLRGAVKQMKEVNPEKFRLTIKNDEAHYQSTLDQYVKVA